MPREELLDSIQGKKKQKKAGGGEEERGVRVGGLIMVVQPLCYSTNWKDRIKKDRKVAEYTSRIENFLSFSPHSILAYGCIALRTGRG